MDTLPTFVRSATFLLSVDIGKVRFVNQVILLIELESPAHALVARSTKILVVLTGLLIIISEIRRFAKLHLMQVFLLLLKFRRATFTST